MTADDNNKNNNVKNNMKNNDHKRVENAEGDIIMNENRLKLGSSSATAKDVETRQLQGAIMRRTHPIYVVCIVPLLCCALAIHLEVNKLYLTHMPARIIVQVEVDQQVSPPGPGWFIEAVLDAADRHLVRSEDIVRNDSQSFHCHVDYSPSY